MADDRDTLLQELEPYRGRKGAIGIDKGDQGWTDLHAAFAGNSGHAGQFLGHSSGEIVARNWRRLNLPRTGAEKQDFRGNTTDPPAPRPAELNLPQLSRDIYELFKGNPGVRYSHGDLSKHFDRSEHTILQALDAIREAKYAIHDTEAGVKLEHAAQIAPDRREDYTRTEWQRPDLLFGVVSDTHIGNLCACEDELQEVYQRFAAAGVLNVFHCGDLMDGPGDLGFRGHGREVREEAYTATGQIRYTANVYPRADFPTFFIQSSKSHEGWAWAKDSFEMGRSLSEGFNATRLGPDMEEDDTFEGRPDLSFIDYDDAVLRVGGERQTSLQLHHPDGGTAYAWSYNAQKWAESLEGGTKPHVAFLGHYHKYCAIMPRNIHCCEVPSLCWQTPFMRRKKIPAHVGALLVELRVDNSGGVLSIKHELWPFYQRQRKQFVVTELNTL
ncbi:MAG TPA: hypothetical protein VMW48_06095, partial [Vicinamibacterales bacterium]|nr:hypothetical protein [Vicinamibacterales bacterium]